MQRTSQALLTLGHFEMHTRLKGFLYLENYFNYVKGEKVII